MAASDPGPLGLNQEMCDLNDGTMARELSPVPGFTCTESSLNKQPTLLPARHASQKKSVLDSLPVLRQKKRGLEVQKLQRQLNARLAPSPQLVVDGIFGPRTLQAVLQYQKGVSIVVDGIVGKQTWYHLLKGEKITILPQSGSGERHILGKSGSKPQSSTGFQRHQTTPVSGSGALTKSSTEAQPRQVTPAVVTEVGVWEWTLEDKFSEALRRTAPKLPISMRSEFELLLNPVSLGIMAGTLVVWAGSHAFGVGAVVDVVLLAGGAFFLGMAVFDVASELSDFLVITSTASDEKDLDQAAAHLARAIAIMGVAAFFALMAKVARGRGGKTGAAETPAKPSTAKAPKGNQQKPLKAINKERLKVINKKLRKRQRQAPNRSAKFRLDTQSQQAL